jgi:hypothetical protein
VTSQIARLSLRKIEKRHSLYRTLNDHARTTMAAGVRLYGSEPEDRVKFAANRAGLAANAA